MKYEVGDKVRIKSFDWYNKNRDEIGQVECGMVCFIAAMATFCDKIVTISSITPSLEVYRIKEDNGTFNWTDEMIEGLAEETKPLTFGDSWECPQGYQFVDENGNVINATKIVLKKKEYPKTYEECCKVLDWDHRDYDRVGYESELLCRFQVLLLCRDAYWKIAGNWKEERKEKSMHYVIRSTMLGEVVKVTLPNCINNYLLDFPTEEMRDAFYENFKELIERCKELL